MEVRPLSGHGRTVGAPGRGAAYLTTLLVVAVAAIIVSALTLVAVGQLRASRLAVDQASARDTLSAATGQLSARLESDPFGYLARVLPGERARVCVADGSVHQPGERWPADVCGVRWGYQQSAATAAALAADEPVARFELHPPSVDDPRLRATVLAYASGVEVGRDLAFFQRGAAEFTAHSDAPLDVDTLFVTQPSPGTRSLYSNSTVYLPSAVTLDDTVFAADGKPALSGVPSGIDNRYFVPRDNAGEVPAGYEWIRDLVAEPRRVGALQASSATTERVGCPLGPDDIPAELPGGTTSRLCLRPGWAAVDDTGAVVTVPDDVTAISIRPTVTAGVTSLQVDVATVDPAPPACTTPCSLTALSGPAVADGVHPGAGSFWQPLGSGRFDMPQSGVVVTGADTYVGRCEQFMSPSGTCAPDATADPMTVLVGSVTDRADLWLSGPVDSAAQLSLVATGEVHVPYFSRPPGGDLTVEAAVVGFSDLDGWTGTVNPFPTPVCTSAALGCEDNAGGAFTLSGSVAGPSLDLRLSGWAQVDLTPSAVDVTGAAPYTPAFDASWVPASTLRIVGDDVCGRAVCASY